MPKLMTGQQLADFLAATSQSAEKMRSLADSDAPQREVNQAARAHLSVMRAMRDAGFSRAAQAKVRPVSLRMRWKP